MKTCPYCGAQYPDEVLFCPVDQHSLRGERDIFVGSSSPDAEGASGKAWIKLAAASVAFLPMFFLILASWFRDASFFQTPVAKSIVLGCKIFNYPAFSCWRLIESFHLEAGVSAPLLLVPLLLWSSLIAWLFWRVAGMFMGEEEAPAQKGKYDWVGFQVRFFLGFVVGFLIGWRFVRYTTSGKTILIASLVSGIVGGFLYGISRPPDFWSRG